MIHARFGQGAAFRFDGKRHRICFVSNGTPAIVHEYDLTSGELLFQSPLPPTDSVWAISATENEDVYLSGTRDGILYRYSSDGLKSVGVNPSNAFVWELFYDQGRIYGGTYPHSKLFEYNTVSGEFRDFGPIKEGQDYCRGIVADDRYLYAGTGSIKHLIRIDRVTGEREEIHLEGLSGTQGFIDKLWIRDDYLFVSCTYTEVHVFRRDSLIHVGSFPCDNLLSKPHASHPGKVFYKNGSRLCYWDIAQETSMETALDSLPFGRCKAMAWVKTDEVEEFSAKLALATVNAELAILDLSDLSDLSAETRMLPVEPQPLRIACLETGEDGKLYIGGIYRGFSLYNPATDEIEQSIGLFPQTEGITFLDGEAYFGTYTHAHMYRYNPEHPMNYGMTPEHNPGHIGRIGYKQDRPFAMTSGGGYVFAGTVPDYGIRGGALSVYDPAAGTWDVYPDIVKDQSILGLAYKEGLIFGGTSIWGGLGVEPAEEPARMFVWDVATRTKITEFVPDIPDMDAVPSLIGGLFAGPDGLIWGAVYGTIFAMDPSTLRVVKSRVIVPTDPSKSSWKMVFLRWGPDGLLYTTLGNRLIAVHPETLDYVQLVDNPINDLTIDQAGRLYYGVGQELFRLVPPKNLFS
ncbi:hypothetical protein [Paenibacillus dakarensis]|uniref:hypothetical protein n=1 Tax=Paenibacillus dakarensis TaxID=1527293 RepID=UPI0006D53914|nr:hypothetical protein [Paenibacillus dakarensis]